jgi:hypothetical protein
MAATGLTQISVTSSTFTLTKDHAGTLIILDRASGVGITLPASTGSGLTYSFLVGTAITSLTSFIKVANSTDVFIGNLATHNATGAVGASFGEAATGADDTLTMNGGTTGGLKGSYIELTDISPGFWLLDGNLIGSGAFASCLSSTV